MIQKFINENILLIPPVLYKEKDKYTFEWTIDNKFTVSGYDATYSFSKTGTHFLSLKYTNIITNIFYIYEMSINVTMREQSYVESVVPDTGGSFGLSPFSITDFGY